MFKKFGKSLTQAFAAVLVVVASVVSGGITEAEGIQIAIAIAGAVGVYLAPNLPQYQWIKTAMAAVSVALMTATSLITDGLTTAEIINIVLAGLGVLGVSVAPSISDTHPPTAVDTGH